MGQSLVGFSGRKEEDGRLFSRRKCREKLLAPKRPDFGRGEDEGASLCGTLDFAQMVAEMKRKVAANVHGIVGRRSFDVNGAHDLFIVSDCEPECEPFAHPASSKDVTTERGSLKRYGHCYRYGLSDRGRGHCRIARGDRVV